MIKQRFLVFIFGIFCTILFFELALRIIGIADDLDRDPVVRVSDSKFKIMAIGNSYTAGSGAPLGESYPNQLGRILEKKQKDRYAVINHGLQNVNTSYILNKVPAWIKANRPDMIFLMVGEPNYWNKYNFHQFLKEYKFPVSDYLLDYYLRYLKLYRWIELIVNEENLFYTNQSPKYSSIFTSVETNEENKNLLGYLWLGGLEKGFLTDRSAFLIYSDLTQEELDEAEKYLGLLFENQKNPTAAKILAELYLYKAKKNENSAPLLIEKSFNYLEAAIRTSDYFDITQSNLLKTPFYSGFSKKVELFNLLKSRISDERAKELRETIGLVRVADIGNSEDCRKLFNLSDYYPSSSTLVGKILNCNLSAESKWRVFDRFFKTNPLTPYFNTLGEGYFLANSSKEIGNQFKTSLSAFTDQISSMKIYHDYFEELRDDNLLKKWIESDLDKITSLLKKTKAKIIIQTYPPLRNGEDRPIDIILRNWWASRKDKKNMQFMDLADILKNKFAQENGGNQFYSMERGNTDNHLSSKGYAEISKLMEDLISQDDVQL